MSPWETPPVDPHEGRNITIALVFCLIVLALSWWLSR